MPKISVLIPMYNSKHHIEQCLNSVFIQTFHDFDVIVRDDGSTDGSSDFVVERYADKISSGKLKLRRNEKNIGEFPTDDRLLREATGKYVMILHDDDLYMPHALEHMYSVAERFKADVVHSTTHLTTPPDGIIKKGTPLKIRCHDKAFAKKKILLIPNNLSVRFDEWESGGTFHDAQYNIFRRKFLMDEIIALAPLGNNFVASNRLFTLNWIMKAKIFVKTPFIFYLKRNSPDCSSNMKMTFSLITKFITDNIKFSRYLDEFFAADEFFKDNERLQYIARSNFFLRGDNFWMNRVGVYKDGITPELHHAVEDAFRKHFGDDCALPTFLFHWIHAVLCGRSVNTIIPESLTTN